MRSFGKALCCGALAIIVGVAAPAQVNHTTSTVRAGSWTHTITTVGSQASFADASRQPLLSFRCTRATRRFSIDVRSAAAPSLLLWTTTASRNLAAVHNPATGLLTAELPVWDNLLDAVAFSRGRFSVTVSGGSPLILPAWPEAARAIDDCRN